MRTTLGPAVIALSLVLAPAARATDRDDLTRVIAFLAIDGIDGESKQKGHEKEIEVLAFGETWRNATTASTGGGQGAGKPTLSPITITKRQGSASPKLLTALLKGEHLQKAVLTFYGQQADGRVTPSYRITLQTVMVVGVKQQSADTWILEEVQLAFEQAKWEVFDPADAATYDAKTGKVNAVAPGGTGR